MAVIEAPRCPFCHERVHAADLREAVARTGSGFSDGEWGVRCGACGTVLGIHRWPVWLVGLSLLAVLCAAVVVLGRFRPKVSKDVFLPAAAGTLAISAFIYMHWAPLFARLRRAEPNERLLVEKSIEQINADDPFYQAELAALDELNEWARQGQGRPVWRCAGCGEDVPGNFDVCWKCKKNRPKGDS
jgi:hypothetical protein